MSKHTTKMSDPENNALAKGPKCGYHRNGPNGAKVNKGTERGKDKAGKITPSGSYGQCHCPRMGLSKMYPWPPSELLTDCGSRGLAEPF